MTPFQPLDDYRWAAGHGIALGSLKNVETDIGAFNRRRAGTALRRVGIASPPLDRFPIRSPLDAGYERGDGIINTQWRLILCTLGYKYVLDTYLSGGTVVSVPMTIYTRIHRAGSYARYNTYLTLPSPEKGTERYLRQDVWELTFDWTVLIAL